MRKLWKKKKGLVLPLFVFLSFSMLLIFLSTSYPDSAGKNIIAFFSIWEFDQWLTSLVSLILLYWISGHFYNKRLAHVGGWLDLKTRVWLIMLDLLLNLALGLYYMHYRDTLMGIIMLRCPIAISPLIFVIEMVFVYMYYLYGKKK